MSDPMVDAALAALKAEVAASEKTIADLQARKKAIRNYRLVTQFDLGRVARFAMFPHFEQVAVARQGTIFYVKGMDVVLSAVGTNPITNTARTTVFSPPQRDAIIKFEYRLRDSGSDREWDNDWVPSSTMLGANVNGMRLDGAHGVVSGGSEIVVALRAQLLAVGADDTPPAITRYILEFNFVGVEVPA